jgi:S-adenosylmethionine-dependent methyltransferase
VADEQEDRPAASRAAGSSRSTGAAASSTSLGAAASPRSLGASTISAWAQARNQGVWDAVADLVRERETDLGRPIRVLDLGGGSGGLAVPLAELGHDVTVVDPSPNALAALERRAADFGVADRITGRQGDADTPAFETDETFDLVCCHGVLEVVDDPTAALAGIAAVLTPKGHLSLLVAGRLAVVLTKALAGDLGQAREALTSPDGRWGKADPLPRRFDIDGLVALLDATGFTPIQVHGVRVFADLVPPTALDSAADREALAELEHAAATHPQYAEALGTLGGGLHAIAQRA